MKQARTLLSLSDLTDLNPSFAPCGSIRRSDASDVDIKRSVVFGVGIKDAEL